MYPPEIERSPYYFAIRRPVTITMIVITAVVFGILSYRLLPINMMPEITYPSLTVRTEYPGAAPEEVENVVTRPLEQALGVVKGLVEMSSSSRAENSDILLEFEWGTDMNQATQDVREKLDLVFLPEEVKPPLILRYDPSLDPMIRIGLTSDSLSLMQLRQVSEDIVKRELEKLPGVAAVKVEGGEESEIRISLAPGRLDLYNLSLEQVVRRLASENINIAGGRLQEGESELILRSLNEFQTVPEIGHIVIARNGDRVVRLDDIAEVRRVAKRRTSITRVAGRESVALELYRESDANPVSVSNLVKERIFGKGKPRPARIPRMKSERPKRAKFKPLAEVLTKRIRVYVLTNQAEFIRLAIEEVKSAALVGGVLAVLVLLMFLGGLRDTLTVAVVIPISLLCTFAVMHLARVTINIMSLGGLALGIGMMVDNAIVVIESIHRRRESGDDPVTASVIGTRTVGGAVTASTLTTVVVFFPIVFVTGVAGQVFGDMALTVVISLSVSLLVALFFIPMLTTRGFSAGGEIPPARDWKRPMHRGFRQFKRGFALWRSWRRELRIPVAPFLFIYLLIKLLLGWFYLALALLLFYVLIALRWILIQLAAPVWGEVVKVFRSVGNAFQRSIASLTETYRTSLHTLVSKPLPVLFLFGLLCIVSFAVLLPRIGGELIPSVSQGVFNVEFTLPVGTPVERTAEAILPIEKSVRRMDEVRMVSSRSGGELTSAEASLRGPNQAVLTVRLTPGGDLEYKENRVAASVRALTARVPDLEMLVTHPALFTFKQPVEVILKRDDLAELHHLAVQVRDQLADLPILTDIESSIRPGYPEIIIVFDRDRLARIGLTTRDAARRVQTSVLGNVPTRFREEERRIDIRVQLTEDSRRSLEDLRQLVINPDQPIPVTLADVARLELHEGPADIKRIGSTRSAVITAAIEGSDLKSAGFEIRSILNDMGLAEEYDYSIRGQRREMEKSLSSLRFALLLAVFLVYVVMASQFESLRFPFLILLTIPLAVAGVIPVLWGLGIPLSIMVFLGLIVLAGIVVNNSIVLVDYANQLLNSGVPAGDAVIEAARTRLRPILMTSLTTVLALLPMALGVGEGVEMRRPMAVTVIFGLLFATLVTLIVTPILIRLSVRERRRK